MTDEGDVDSWIQSGGIMLLSLLESGLRLWLALTNKSNQYYSFFSEA